MRYLALAVFALLFALPAHAQHAGAAPSGTTNSGGGGYGGSMGGADFSDSSHIPQTQFTVVIAHGSAQDFVPSTFMCFSQAVKIGEAELAYQTKTLGEVAREYRAEKAHKYDLDKATDR
jgi:hypothetical protein